MNMKINRYPKNEEAFKQVIAFGKEIKAIIDKVGVDEVLVYGSLAYFCHTQDVSLPVNDIDFLLDEKYFKELIPELEKLEDVRVEVKPYNSIELYKGDLEIDLDSIEHFLDPRSRKSVQYKIDGLKINVVSKEVLADIYQEALDNMPNEPHLDEKRRKYQQKRDHLQNKV